MRPLKLALAALIGLLALGALAMGFVVVAALGAVVILILGLRRLFTGKPFGTVRFQFRRRDPDRAPSPFHRDGAIDIEATPARPPPKSLER